MKCGCCGSACVSPGLQSKNEVLVSGAQELQRRGSRTGRGGGDLAQWTTGRWMNSCVQSARRRKTLNPQMPKLSDAAGSQTSLRCSADVLEPFIGLNIS